MIPRRFFALAVFCGVALISLFLFSRRSEVTLSVPVPIPDSWADTLEQTWEQAWQSSGYNKQDDAHDDNQKWESPPKKPGFIQGEPGGKEAGSNTKPLAVGTATPHGTGSYLKPTPFPPPDPPLPDVVNVAIVESGGTNEETTAALINAFGTQNYTQLSLYMLQQRYGIGEIINNFNLSHPILVNKSSEDFEAAVRADDVSPHIIVSATCEADLLALNEPLTKLLERKDTYLFCVIHQPERWVEQNLIEKLQPWINAQLVDLVALSHHTARYLRTDVINAWDFNATVTVRHLAPLFPMQLPNDELARAMSSTLGADTFQYPIAMHGDFDATRHNYSEVFDKIVELKDRVKKGVKIETKEETKIEKREISLHILGERAPPDVPKKVKPLLSVDHALPLQEQYEILSKSYILLPAFSFGSESDYLSKLASWCIPAALIAGVPFAADDNILDAYGYVSREAVWYRLESEDEMKIAERVLMWSEEEHRRKKASVRKHTQLIIQRQLGVVDEWIRMGIRRAERAGWRMKADNGEGHVADAPGPEDGINDMWW
ncbi:uncharacterized protein PV09_00111 [Verruconis gallopava]|uniref:Glycosyl transferase family 1 domain-containing protein n=1 Tax=Verruconis gallopava TaxID=253628 RepID=A0A0D2ARN2_9PEZI|nr:uncharacterized protein PV09_00111 [Verruconis gallopava]KIW09180.1 hypothetical protein PV09_00111 [Verruconis gallopava]